MSENEEMQQEASLALYKSQVLFPSIVIIILLQNKVKNI